MKKFLIKFFVFLLFMSIAIGSGLFYALVKLDEWANQPLIVTDSVQVDLKPLTGLSRLSESLETKGLISSRWAFQIWIRLEGNFKKFQSGPYLFTGQVSPKTIQSKMIAGDITIPYALQLTIPEGFTLRQLSERMEAKGLGNAKSLQVLMRKKSFIYSLKIDSASLEGFTYPATYSFKETPTAEEFLQKTVQTFFEKLPDSYETNAKNSGLTLTQAVTFASLIELETMQESEKPMIAEVIWRRLKKGEPLGIDAALIYGIPDYTGDIKWSHLKDQKNPYNTRIHKGLPPTPIGAVSKSSLEAVLTPTNLGYHYYVVDADDRKKHVFSRTSQEHNRAVKRYLDAYHSDAKGAP